MLTKTEERLLDMDLDVKNGVKHFPDNDTDWLFYARFDLSKNEHTLISKGKTITGIKSMYALVDQYEIFRLMLLDTALNYLRNNPAEIDTFKNQIHVIQEKIKEERR